MANGNGEVVNKIIVGIATAGILGCVGLAIAQAQTAEKVSNNAKKIAAREAVVSHVAVIENEIENIQEKLDAVKQENDADHAIINARMEKNKQEILDAIGKIRYNIESRRDK
jgi:hypothetical protein